jgi:hypothetical protein
MRLAVVGIAGLLLPAPSFAQGAPDSRWAPWTGCWHVETDATRGGPPSRPRAQVCVAADGPGVTITTTPEGATPMTQHVTADDVARPITDGSCSGTEQSAWSKDGFRLYSRAALTCAAGARRQVSGLSLLAPDGTWIEAQAIEIGDRSSVRVRRFVKDDGPPATPARGRLTIEHVLEASRRVAAPALEAALVEARATFGLTRSALIALDGAGVPSSVIDVMVALTYPQAFAIHPASRADRLTAFPFEADPLDAGGLWWPGGPATSAGYFDSAYFLSPFGYSAFGAYPIFFGGGGADDGTAGGGGSPPVTAGRVINRLGYTRLAPRGAEDAGAKGAGTAGTTSGRSTISSRGYTRGSDGGASSTGSSAGSSTGSGGGSSGGSSGSGSTGRTAVDR